MSYHQRLRFGTKSGFEYILIEIWGEYPTVNKLIKEIRKTMKSIKSEIDEPFKEEKQ